MLKDTTGVRDRQPDLIRDLQRAARRTDALNQLVGTATKDLRRLGITELGGLMYERCKGGECAARAAPFAVNMRTKIQVDCNANMRAHNVIQQPARHSAVAHS